MELLNIVGFMASSWGIIMSVAPILQMVRLSRTRSSDDVSLGYFGILMPGFALWVAYGVLGGDAFVAVPNILSLLVTGALVTMVIVMRVRADHQPLADGASPAAKAKRSAPDAR